MRILHVIATYEIGGAETVALRLAKRQLADGHDVAVVAWADGGEMQERFRAAGIRTLVLEKGGGLDVTMWPRVVPFLLKERPQVVHTHNPAALVYAAPAARALGKVTVHTMHGEVALGRELWLRRAAGLGLHAFVAVSKRIEEVARQHNEVWSRKIQVIDNGIDTEMFAPDAELRAEVRAELGFSDGEFVVGTVGRLQPIKNQALLVRAMAPLTREGRRLVLVGDGPERAALESLVKELDVEAGVKLLGYRSDVGRLIQAFDCFSMSSRSEGLPLVLLEAMATALPVVSTAVGGIPQVAEGCGQMVPEGDESALRAALADISSDKNAARELGRKARRRVIESYSMAEMAQRYMAIYETHLR
jgi:sugar transferase (PEP-CTERM/EpsH1 system associated)